MGMGMGKGGDISLPPTTKTPLEPLQLGTPHILECLHFSGKIYIQRSLQHQNTGRRACPAQPGRKAMGFDLLRCNYIPD